jgi:hypothetical protein
VIAQRFNAALKDISLSVDAVGALTEMLLQKETQLFWGDFGWALVEDEGDRNPDQIPEDFKLDFGCATCGSAWGEVLAFGFTAPRVLTGHLYFAEGRPRILLDTSEFDDKLVASDGHGRPRAVRLVCLGGHVTEFDSVTRRTCLVFMPTTMVAVAVAGMAMMAAMRAP